MAELYHYMYMIFIAILSYFVFEEYSLYSENKNSVFYDSGRQKALYICLLIAIYIGLRPVDRYFGDMTHYYLRIAKHIYYLPLIRFDVTNIVFENLINYWSYRSWGCIGFFILISIIYYGGIYIACCKIFPHNVLFAFLVYIAAFSTFSYGANGIKAGAAASIFLIALSYYDKLYIAFPLMFVSWGFHHSMSMPIMAFVLVKIWRNPEHYFYFWLFCLIMAAGHITFFQTFLAGYTDKTGAEYLSSNGENWIGRAGFRIDFIVYSIMPVIVGWISKFKLRIEDSLYDNLISLYLVCNGLWVLCMYTNYNNRIAYLSWFLYPFVLLYPTFKQEWQDAGFYSSVKTASLHLLFTLFMTFIYY